MALKVSPANAHLYLDGVRLVIGMVIEAKGTMNAQTIQRLWTSSGQLILKCYGSNSSVHKDYKKIDRWPSQYNLDQIIGLLRAVQDDLLLEVAKVKEGPSTNVSNTLISPDYTKLLLPLFYNNPHYNLIAIKNLIRNNSDYYDYSEEMAAETFKRFIERNIIAYTGVGEAYCITEEGKKLYTRIFNLDNVTSAHTSLNSTNIIQQKMAENIDVLVSIQKPKIFLSYSWDSTLHQEKVVSLANHLRKNGFNAQIDVMVTGQETAINFMKMMYNEMHQADKVIILLSEGYKRKADEFTGGVGKEYEILLNDIHEQPNKYILASFEEINQEIIPFGLKNREIVSCATPGWERKLFAKLLGEPLYQFAEVAAFTPTIDKIIPGDFLEGSN